MPRIVAGLALLALMTLTRFLAPVLVSAWRTEDDPRRVALVLLGPVEDDSERVQLTYDVDLSGRGPEAKTLDPLSRVVTPGTSSRRLRDAYSFGGGTGIAAAVARSEGGATGEHVVLPYEVWTRWADRAGGVRAEPPHDMNLFVAGELHSLRRGRRTLKGAEVNALVCALSWGKNAGGRRQDRLRVGRRTFEALARCSNRERLDALTGPGVETSVGERGLRDLAVRLRRADVAEE